MTVNAATPESLSIDVRPGGDHIVLNVNQGFNEFRGNEARLQILLGRMCVKALENEAERERKKLPNEAVA